MTRDDALRQLTGAGEPFELVNVLAMSRSVRVFKNAPPTLRDLYSATRSEAPFIVYEDEPAITFEAGWRQACNLARVLVDDFGVRKGDRVAISMRNFPEWITAFVAASSVGAIAVAMNAHWQHDEMEFALKDSRACVLFADQERLERLAACKTKPEGLQVVAVRADVAPGGAVHSFAELVAADVGGEMPDVRIEPDDDATMLYTSGSTGHPKGAVSTHRNVISALLSWELDTQAAILTGLIEAPAPDASPVSLLGIPLFHVSGSHAVLLSSYRAQRKLVAMRKWDPERAAELIERELVTGFVAPSAVTGDLVQVARTTKRDLSSLGVVGGGGAARAPGQVRAISETFGKAIPNTGWGMTETNAIGTGIAGADYLEHPESSGRASAVLDIRIVNEIGETLPTGARGELQVRGASIFRGYWERPEANAQTFDGEWMRTGDVAYIDADGFMYIVDRIKDLVIRGGENIGCGSVESALLEYPQIVEASVYGVPDERMGEELGATVFADGVVDEDLLRDFLRSRLAGFQVPRYLHFEVEPLPRIASGKILKRQLRDEAIARVRQGAGKS